MGRTKLFNRHYTATVRWFVIALFYFTCNTLLHGQYLDPFCQNILSGSKPASNLTLDWNMGEPLYTETIVSKANMMLSIGFLQNQNEAIRTFKNIDSFKLKILIGPNPMQENFTISCTQDGLDILCIKIIDAFGNSIQEINGPYSGLNFQKKINLLSENKGIYYVIVNYVLAGKFTAYKVFKLLKI
jgi:hypothetical protein